jgi:hypothetical protein
MLFKTTPTAEILEETGNFAYPFWLFDYYNQPKWVRESFAIVKLEFQFLRFIMALECHGDEDSPKLKDFLTNPFFGSWRASSRTQRDQITVSRCCDSNSSPYALSKLVVGILGIINGVWICPKSRSVFRYW